jgi:hypothetical protein
VADDVILPCCTAKRILTGLERIGFIHAQQIIWDKGTAALTRTHYWFAPEPCWCAHKEGHEPCWYARKKNAPWEGKPGESTIWRAKSPKMIMAGSVEKKLLQSNHSCHRVAYMSMEELWRSRN